jgi:hypothetical protein
MSKTVSISFTFLWSACIYFITNVFSSASSSFLSSLSQRNVIITFAIFKYINFPVMAYTLTFRLFSPFPPPHVKGGEYIMTL